MSGGVSHVDSLDPKPKLFARRGQDRRGGRISGPQRGLQDVPQAAAVGVRPARRMRHGGQLAVSAHRRVRGRALRDPLDEVGPHESLQRDAGHAHRLVHVRPAEHRQRGSATAWAREPQPAVVRGDRAAVARMPAARSGAATSCPARTRARWSSRARSRSPTSAPRRRPAGCRSSSSA